MRQAQESKASVYKQSIILGTLKIPQTGFLYHLIKYNDHWVLNQIEWDYLNFIICYIVLDLDQQFCSLAHFFMIFVSFWQNQFYLDALKLHNIFKILIIRNRMHQALEFSLSDRNFYQEDETLKWLQLLKVSSKLYNFQVLEYTFSQWIILEVLQLPFT